MNEQRLRFRGAGLSQTPTRSEHWLRSARLRIWSMPQSLGLWGRQRTLYTPIACVLVTVRVGAIAAPMPKHSGP
jgi:hypothetical protein